MERSVITNAVLRYSYLAQDISDQLSKSRVWKVIAELASETQIYVPSSPGGALKSFGLGCSAGTLSISPYTRPCLAALCNLIID